MMTCAIPIGKRPLSTHVYLQARTLKGAFNAKGSSAENLMKKLTQTS